MTDANSLNEKAPTGPVTRKTLIADVLDSRPDAGRVLRETFKLPCEECVVSEKETIEEGAAYYNLDADAIVAKLNECALAPPENKNETPA
jgi:hybrid cluster-associated redox disulfide protein